MNLSIIDDKLQIEFSLKEQLLALRFHKVWEIPLTHIQQVTTAEPQSNWKELLPQEALFLELLKQGLITQTGAKNFGMSINRQII